MKITLKVGLVGFLLALSSINIPKAESTNNNNQPTIESRLGRIAKVIREKETQASLDKDSDLFYLAGGFLNSSPSFRNSTSGWLNNVKGWVNAGGGFVNKAGGGGFVNKAGGGGFANGGRSGGFANR